MRTVKNAEERKNEILDAAEVLFARKGFEETSTGDILEMVGIARGTLYYHFRSKEEILDSVVQRMTNEMMHKAALIVSDKKRPVLDRLSDAVMALNLDSDLAHEILEQVHKPQNALMHQKMQERLLNGIVPILTKLIQEGMEQKICDTDYPREAVEMIMLYANVMFDDQMIQSEEERQKRIQAFIYNAERLFHMEEGQLQQAILRIFNR